MKLPNLSELRDPDAIYLYHNDANELYGRKGWLRYLYMNRFDLVIDFLRQNLEKNSVVVDIGSAQGNFSLTLANIGYQVYSIDIRPSFVLYAKLKMDMREKNNVNFIVCDAKNVPLQKGFADCVLMLEILEHTAQPERMINECLSILKEDAYLIVSTPNLKRIGNSRIMSWSDFKNEQPEGAIHESSAKGWEHIFEFSRSELLSFLKRPSLKIIDAEIKTIIGFRLLARLFDYEILTILENLLFRFPPLKERFGMNLIFFAKRTEKRALS
jgi:SAM-dependent methyltransferase